MVSAFMHHPENAILLALSIVIVTHIFAHRALHEFLRKNRDK